MKIGILETPIMDNGYPRYIFNLPITSKFIRMGHAVTMLDQRPDKTVGDADLDVQWSESAAGMDLAILTQFSGKKLQPHREVILQSIIDNEIPVIIRSSDMEILDTGQFRNPRSCHLLERIFKTGLVKAVWQSAESTVPLTGYYEKYPEITCHHLPATWCPAIRDLMLSRIVDHEIDATGVQARLHGKTQHWFYKAYNHMKIELPIRAGGKRITSKDPGVVDIRGVPVRHAGLVNFDFETDSKSTKLSSPNLGTGLYRNVNKCQYVFGAGSWYRTKKHHTVSWFVTRQFDGVYTHTRPLVVTSPVEGSNFPVDGTLDYDQRTDDMKIRGVIPEFNTPEYERIRDLQYEFFEELSIDNYGDMLEATTQSAIK